MIYPSEYRIGISGYKLDPDDGTEQSRADDGTLHLRRLFPATRYSIQIPHPFVTGADYAALQAFYETNKSDVQFTDPITGVQYTGKLTKPPAITAWRSAVYCDVMMYFEGVVVE